MEHELLVSLVTAIGICFGIMVLLQTFLNRRVWPGYLLGLFGCIIAWVVIVYG